MKRSIHQVIHHYIGEEDDVLKYYEENHALVAAADEISIQRLQHFQTEKV